MKTKILCVFVSILIVSHFCFNFVFSTEDIDTSMLEEMKQEVLDNIENSNLNLEYITEDLSGAMLEMQKLEDKALEYKFELDTLSNQLDYYNDLIIKTKEELEEVEDEYTIIEDALMERMVWLYEVGETTYLDILLNSKNIIEFVSGYFLISEMISADVELINMAASKKKSVETVELKLAQEEQQIKIIKATTEQVTLVYNNAIALQQEYIVNLTEEEIKLQEEITAYKNEQLKLELLIYTAMNTDGIYNIQYTGGELLWPVAAENTRISSPFGMRIHPVSGIYAMHTGIDIAGVPEGTPIVASYDGVVTYAGWLGGYR